MENNNETVTISKKEYETLLKDSLFLQCLREVGVNNWDGYDYAVEIMREQKAND